MNKLTLNNPKYGEMLRLGKSTRWTPAQVTIPILTTNSLPAPHKTTIELYSDQEPVFNASKDQTTNLIEAMTGAGKTVISIALHQTWGGRTLVVCHSLVMAKQFAREFYKFIDLQPTYFCDGKHNMSGEVVVTTLSTFRKKYELFKDFDNLIVDEADLAMTNKMLKAITEFDCIRKHGFTGTIKTVYDDCNKDHRPILAKFWGHHVIHESDKEIPLKAVHYHQYKKTYEDVFPHLDWQEFRKALDEDIDRKKAQLEYITNNTDPTHHTLALWDRVADVEAFYAAFKKRGYNVYMSTGQMNKSDRDQHLQDFKKTGGYLVGVSATLNRGYDNTLLTKAFIMYPVKGENPIRQIIGRIMRHYKDKESELYIWADSMLEFQSVKQKQIIKKQFSL